MQQRVKNSLSKWMRTIGYALIIAFAVGGCGLAYGATPKSKPTVHDIVLQKMDDVGIQAIEVGDTVKLVIPLSLVFLSDSPRLLPEGIKVLNLVAFYIYAHRKVDVKVAAYTDNTWPPNRAFALTQQQAQYVAQYLWACGIDTRLLSAVGYGALDPIANNAVYLGREKNHRIEITFRQVTD